MKQAIYQLAGGVLMVVPYDENAPCKCCGFPVESASVGGTNLCPKCDMGYWRSARCPWYAKIRPEKGE